MVFRFQHRLAATAVLAALALPVLAQQPPAAPLAAGATATPEGRHKAAGDRHEHRARHQAHMAKRMATLKDQLKLSAAQEPAWTAFTAAMQPGERTARLDRKDMDKLTTPERIDRMRALRAQHAAEADRRGAASSACAITTTAAAACAAARAIHRPPRRRSNASPAPPPHSLRGGGMGDGPRGPLPACSRHCLLLSPPCSPSPESCLDPGLCALRPRVRPAGGGVCG
jgi:hypothetical protein